MSNHCEDRGIVHFSNILCENKTVRAGEGMVGFINLVKSLTGTQLCACIAQVIKHCTSIL